MKINTYRDLVAYIADQPIDTSQYIDNYAEIVAFQFCHVLEDKGFSWGDSLADYDINDDDFWECFKIAEKKANT